MFQNNVLKQLTPQTINVLKTIKALKTTKALKTIKVLIQLKPLNIALFKHFKLNTKKAGQPGFVDFDRFGPWHFLASHFDRFGPWLFLASHFDRSGMWDLLVSHFDSSHTSRS